MQTVRTEAIILRRTNYGEADRILQLLTPEHGKISVIAKGVRRAKSKLAGGLELFATSDVVVMKGRSDMGVITTTRLKKFYGDILQSYERMQLGYECIKRIDQASATVGEKEFYYLLRDCFMYLHAGIDHRIIELWFRLQLIALLGHGLNMASDTQGQHLRAESHYNFDFTDMAFALHAGGAFGASHIKLLRLAAAKDPAILRHVGGLDEVLAECLWLVRTFDQ